MDEHDRNQIRDSQNTDHHQKRILQKNKKKKKKKKTRTRILQEAENSDGSKNHQRTSLLLLQEAATWGVRKHPWFQHKDPKDSASGESKNYLQMGLKQTEEFLSGHEPKKEWSDCRPSSSSGTPASDSCDDDAVPSQHQSSVQLQHADRKPPADARAL